MARDLRALHRLGVAPIAQFCFLPLCSLGVVLGEGFPMVMPKSFLLPGAAILLLIGVALTWKKRYRAATGALLGAVIAALPVLSVKHHSAPEPVRAAGLLIAQLNVHESNHQYEAVITSALSSGADVLSIQEVGDEWHNRLSKELANDYPWSVFGPGERNYGLALFSKFPLGHAEVLDLNGLPAIHAEVSKNGSSLVVVSAHLRSPESSLDFKQRNRQWEMLAKVIRACKKPCCLIGDLNTVPWDEAFMKFETATRMQHGPRFLLPTWPAFQGLALIPLDHVLTSRNCMLSGKRTMGIPGSDHLGFKVQVDWVRPSVFHLPGT